MRKKRVLTEEHKQKISYALQGEKHPMYGKKHNDEVRKNMSDGQKKRYENPEEREKASKKQQQRYNDPNEREKLSAAQKKRYEDVEMRKRISKEIIRITEEGVIIEYYGAREAERQTGIKASAICACCKGKRKTAGGSQWLYKEDYENILKENKKIEVV